jgi:hypothetical protein
VFKTKTDQGGGKKPKWNDPRMKFRVTSEDKYCKIEVFDEDNNNDEIIGSTRYLINTSAQGVIRLQQKLNYQNNPAGVLNLETQFIPDRPVHGPIGTFYMTPLKAKFKTETKAAFC